MKKKMKRVGILTGLCAVALCAGAYKCIEVGASDTAELWDGFAITATAIRTADPTGLRFKTDVERLTPTMKKYNPDAEYYTVLTLTTGGKKYTTTRYADVWRPDGNGWNTVLLGIPESDYETKVTAQSFVKLNDEAFYQTQPVTISIAQTAAAAMSYGATSEYITQYVDEIVTDIVLEQTTASMEVGQTVALTATTTPSGYMAKWTTSDKTVATVDNKGNVKAKSVGTATITAQINGHTATCQVTVTERDESITPFASEASLGLFGSRDITVAGTWLNGIFADERIDAVAFTIKSTEATGLTTTCNLLDGSLSADTAVSVTFTRSMYEVWQASGNTNFVITSDLASYSSATVYFSNFKKVWAIDESETLTKAELAALDGSMPEYISGKKFDFYGYSNPSDGKWTIDGVEYSAGEDFRTVERYEEYKETGMNIFFPQSSAQINYGKYTMEATAQESWNEVKVYYDRAYEAGLTKGIFNDERLRHLSIQTQTLIGEGKSLTGSGETYGFETQAELDAYVAECLSLYKDHPIFYGVYLQDEPKYNQAVAYGETYQAIKRVMPECFVQYNLLPLVTYYKQVNSFYPAVDGYDCTDDACTEEEAIARYKAYIHMFLDSTGADHICYDHYPMVADGVKSQFIIGLQTVAGICKERDIDLHFVAQTIKMDAAGALEYRAVSEQDARWINNMLLGFGVENIAYFTYWTRSTNKTDGEYFYDEGSFVTKYGEKTDIYYYMREIMSENQQFAPTILSFDYQASAVYTISGAYGTNHVRIVRQESFEKLADVSVNTESALVSELYDSVNNRYMYMVQNVIDSTYQTAGTLQTVKLSFNETYEYAIVWQNGERSVVKLQNNEYVVKLQSGEATFIIPFYLNDDECLYDDKLGDNIIQFPDDSGASLIWKDIQ